MSHKLLDVLRVNRAHFLHPRFVKLRVALGVCLAIHHFSSVHDLDAYLHVVGSLELNLSRLLPPLEGRSLHGGLTPLAFFSALIFRFDFSLKIILSFSDNSTVSLSVKNLLLMRNR